MNKRIKSIIMILALGSLVIGCSKSNELKTEDINKEEEVINKENIIGIHYLKENTITYYFI